MDAWSAWPALAPDPVLDPGTIVVVALDLAGDAGDETLDELERARAARFLDSRLAQRYVRAHVGLRHILARYAGGVPSALRFAYGPHGRPELTDHRWLSFSLTHAQDRALIAIARDRQVGVDLEPVSSRPEDLAVAARWLGPAQAEALASLPTAEQAAAFCAAWTRAEARWKSRGCGMAAMTMPEAASGAEPVVADLVVGLGWVAAVAAPGTWVVEHHRL